MYDEDPPVKTLDVSVLSYEEWLRYFFDRPFLSGQEEYDAFSPPDVDYHVISRPNTVVAYLERLSREHRFILESFSLEQVGQGLWGMFEGSQHLISCLFHPMIDRDKRVQCIEAMYCVFEEVAMHAEIDVKEYFYWMWWDMVLHHFWCMANYEEKYELLTEDMRMILDAMLRTVTRILGLDNQGCQSSALHGLGHLHHPSVRQIVQDYSDAHRSELSESELQWVEECREGIVL
ncbi:MAG: hypothetical protein ACRD96_11800 [Bryobacteraceae bacterium]